MSPKSITRAQARLARIARGQLGLFTRAQARACGFSDATIWRRCKNGAWDEVEHGIFTAATSVDTTLQRALAVVLASGEDAMLSHMTALAIWDLANVKLEAPFHVTVPSRRERRLRRGILHCPSSLDPSDRVLVGRVPVTAVPRTLADNAGGLPFPLLEDTVIEAVRRRLATIDRLEEILDCLPNLPGRGKLRDVLGRFDPEDARRLMSRLETRFLVRVIAAYHLPRPAINRRLRDKSGLLIARVDFSWPWAKLVVEIDGLRFHSSPSQKAYDDARQNAIVLSGQRVLRYSARALDDPGRIAADIGVLLGR